MNAGNTTTNDFCHEQPSLVEQSFTCIWCGDIFQCIDVKHPCQAHGHCPNKEHQLTKEPEFTAHDFYS